MSERAKSRAAQGLSALALMLCLATGLAGCGTRVAVGTPQEGEVPSEAVYRRGTFIGSIGADIEPTFVATLRALDSLKVFRTHEYNREKNWKEVVGRAVMDKRVVVTLKQRESGITVVKIRHGKMGSLPESQRIFEAILKSFEMTGPPAGA